MGLDPAVATSRPMTAKMDDIFRRPRTSLASLHPVVKAVGLSATPFAKPTGSFRHKLAALSL